MQNDAVIWQVDLPFGAGASLYSVELVSNVTSIFHPTVVS